MVEDVCERPNDYWPKVFQVVVRYAVGAMDPANLVVFITVLVMLALNGGGSSVRGLVLPCVLSISPTVESCWSRDMEE